MGADAPPESNKDVLSAAQSNFYKRLAQSLLIVCPHAVIPHNYEKDSM